MHLSSLRITSTGLAAGLAGGLAGVLLSMLTLQHPPLTLLTGLIAPLPLMIAALGFGPLSGALAVAVGSIFVVFFDMKLGHLVLGGARSPSVAGLDVLVFLVALGLPSWLLGMAARTPISIATTRGMRPEEWLLARIALIAVLFGALAVATIFAIAITANGGYDAFNGAVTDAFDQVWRLVAENRSLPSGLDAHQVAVELTWLMPPLVSGGVVIFYLVNLWLAARIAKISDLLRMPWPDIPRHVRLPRAAALVLAVSLGLSLLGGGVGLVSRVVSAALIAALALQGLAVIHSVTRGRGSRLPVLVIVYLSIVALMPWPLLFWGAVGLLDTAFSFRDRQRPAVLRKP